MRPRQGYQLPDQFPAHIQRQKLRRGYRVHQDLKLRGAQILLLPIIRGGTAFLFVNINIISHLNQGSNIRAQGQDGHGTAFLGQRFPDFRRRYRVKIIRVFL